MRKFLTLLFLVLTVSLSANATNYYFAANGSDGNSGTSSSSPWQTLNKFNSISSSLNPGDNVLFNKGDVFYGSITISKSGSSGSPITIGAYGSGAMPIISGFTNVNSWANLGNNIWESSSSVSSLSSCNMVVVNGVNTPMGRYPNSGWLTYQSFSGNTSITSSSLSGSTNWTGAEAVIRKQRYQIDRSQITSQSGGTLNYKASSTYNGQNGYGFFIQNDSRTLDVQNEWYYNPSTGKIRIYSSSNPGNINMSTVNVLVNIPNKNFITFDNISFQGSNSDAFTIKSSANVTIQNCDIEFSGQDAIWGATNGGASSANFVLQNTTMNQTNNNAINLENEFTGPLISHNTIKNTGMLIGMGGNGASNYGTFIGIQTRGTNAIIEYNEIDNTGFIGITFSNNNVIVRNNFLNGFLLEKADGAGIYNFFGSGNTPTGQKIINNIAINGIGSNDGTPFTDNPIAHGIYLDEGATNVEVSGNTVANCSNTGLYIHNSNNLNIFNNTSYNNGKQQALFVSSDNNSPLRNISFTNNILFSSLASQYTGVFETNVDDIRSFGTFNNNCWLRPIDDNITFLNDTYSYTIFSYLTLAQWQLYSGQDANSTKSPKAITDVNDLRFEYNASSSSKTISLGANYIDARSISYNGTITLAPYTSAVLIKNGPSTNGSPVANAGPDQTISTSTVYLSGSGSEVGGTITSYSWTWVSGPNKPTIVNSGSAATSVTGLQPGVHVFNLTVTDSNGATNTDQLSVTVVNNLTAGTPIANAGPDQTISTSTVYLSGSGLETGGTITSYSWIWERGPNNPTIVNSGNPSTSVTGLQPGVHVFALTVTDNNGVTSTDELSVTVLNTLLLAGTPVADAGPDQTISTSAVYLSGSGSETGGTIASYSWKWVRGPNTPTIVNSSSAATSVTGLQTGTHVFSLTVTDNNGVTNTDMLSVVVNNIVAGPPVANAGPDQTISTSTVYLSGSGSETGGTIASYSWKWVRGPNTPTIVNSSSAATSVTGLQTGTHVFSLTVTDNNGVTNTDMLSVVVNNIVAGPPVANAGPDQTISTSTVYLSGSGSETGGTIASYSWKWVRGPNTPTIVNSSSAATSVTGLQTGTHVFSLTVTDNNGVTNTDMLSVVVNNIVAGPPVANAGPDQTISTSTVYLSGSGSETGGTIASYSWKWVRGPNTPTIVNSSSAATSVTGLKTGTHVFSLTVTDNNGVTNTDMLSVVVLANALSTVNAADQTIISTQVGIKAYPNPFVDYINVNITGGAAGKYELILTDALGQILWTKSGTKNAGNFNQSINTSTLKSGIYFLKVVQNDTNSVIKLVK